MKATGLPDDLDDEQGDESAIGEHCKFLLRV